MLRKIGLLTCLMLIGGIVQAEMVKTGEQTAFGLYWENLFFILALIGLAQGMISRAGIGQFVIVGVVMPAIATWSMLSGAPFPNGIGQNLGYIGMELLGTFLFAMAGWSAGIGIRRGVHKLLYRK